MRPHISGTERIGFLKQDTFRLLPKVSGANVRWVNANHTFLTHKNPQTDTSSHDISPAKLCSTAFSVPTHPFRVLGLWARGKYLGEFSICKYHGCGGTPGDVCSGNLPDFPVKGASLGHTCSMQSYPLPKRIAFPLNANVVSWSNYLQCPLWWRCCNEPVCFRLPMTRFRQGESENNASLAVIV
jgi:hypothetical protein